MWRLIRTTRSPLCGGKKDFHHVYSPFKKSEEEEKEVYIRTDRFPFLLVVILWIPAWSSKTEFVWGSDKPVRKDSDYIESTPLAQVPEIENSEE